MGDREKVVAQKLKSQPAWSTQHKERPCLNKVEGEKQLSSNFHMRAWNTHVIIHFHTCMEYVCHHSHTCMKHVCHHSQHYFSLVHLSHIYEYEGC